MSPPGPSTPEHIGPYRVLWPVARGGMAEVYEVEDPHSGEHLGLKLLVNEEAGLHRFNREYEAMTRLNHPNIVRVYRYGLHERMPWLSMELLYGRTVASHAKRVGRPGEPVRTAAVLRAVHGLARALEHIHRRGLVHRDLKSANVLVLGDGRPKLIDFGSAKVLDSDPITEVREFIGTFDYAAPEQILLKPVDHRTDLYALGVLMYRLLSGRLPFRGKDAREVAARQVKAQPEPLAERVQGLPPELVELVEQLLAKSPDDRPSSAREVADLVEDLAPEVLEPTGTLDIDTRKRLVGREEQLARVRRFLDQAEPSSVALVIGRHGSGRTRLVQVAEGEARERGWPTFRCNLSRGGDLSPVVRMVRRMAKMVSDTTAIEEAEAELSRADAVSFGLTRRNTFRDAAELVLAELGRRSKVPVLLLLRHFGSASPAAVDLLVHLLAGARDRGDRVIAVAECDVPAADPGGVARRAFPSAIRVRMPPLQTRGTANLVGALVHRRPPPAAVARRIAEVTGGRPAYIEEVVSGLVEQGLLRPRGADPDRIEWAQEALDISVPTSARRELNRLLSELPVDRLRVLEVLALLEGVGDDRVVARALDRRVEHLAPALAELGRRGLISTEDVSGRQRLHWRDKLAESVVIDGLHPCRRDVLQRRLLEMLVQAPPFAAQLRLLVATNQLGEAVRRGLRWGRHYLGRYQPVTALRVLDHLAERTVAATDVSREQLGQLFLLHANCSLMARPTDPRTGKSMARAATFARGTRLDADVALLQARGQRAIGHYARFREYLETGWERVDSGERPLLAATIALQLGDALRLAGRVGHAASWYERAMSLGKRRGDALMVAMGRVGMGWLQLHRGRLIEAESIARRSLRVFDEREDARGRSLAEPLLADALRRQGRYSEALSRLGPLASRLRDGEAPSLYVRVLLAQGWIELDLSRFGRVQELVDELGATLRRGEHLHLRLEADLLRGHILMASDQPHEARVVAIGVIRRASAGDLVPLEARARALAAAIDWKIGDERSSSRRFRESCTRLQHLGDQLALADAIVIRARAMPSSTRPRELFAPLLPLLREQPLYPLELERTIARVRYLSARGADARRAREHGQQVLERIRGQLADTDRAALRVHPWTRVIPLRDDASGLLR